MAAMTPEQRAAILAPTTDFSAPERFETLSGGSATNRSTLNRNAFSQPSANLSFEQRADFFVGNGLFRRNWVTAPSSTQGADGLGPLYNARGCQGCHLKDGRGHPPAGPDDSAVSMFLRLSIPPRDDAERALLADHRANTIAEPTYGGQLQDLAIPGHAPEGRMVIDYTETPVELADGEVAHLRAPELPDRGPRLRADPSAGDAEPARGAADDRPRAARGGRRGGHPRPCRSRRRRSAMASQAGRTGSGAPSTARSCSVASAGRPASRPSISRAATPWPGTSASAIRSRRPPGAIAPPPRRHAARRRTATARNTTASRRPRRSWTRFCSTRAISPYRPAAMSDDPTVLRGKRLFYESGCIACHVPKLATRRDWEVPALAGQLIWPYTDLLLHDMGPGARRSSAGGRGRWPGVADAAAVGHRPHRDGQRPYLLPARRARAQSDRGHPLARRRGSGRPRCLCRAEQGATGMPCSPS